LWHHDLQRIVKRTSYREEGEVFKWKKSNLKGMGLKKVEVSREAEKGCNCKV
jgi:hypothetical protein